MGNIRQYSYTRLNEFKKLTKIKKSLKSNQTICYNKILYLPRFVFFDHEKFILNTRYVMVYSAYFMSIKHGKGPSLILERNVNNEYKQEGCCSGFGETSKIRRPKFCVHRIFRGKIGASGAGGQKIT